MTSKACLYVKFDIENWLCVENDSIRYLVNWNWVRENAKANSVIEKKNLKIETKVEKDKKEKK